LNKGGRAPSEGLAGRPIAGCCKPARLASALRGNARVSHAGNPLQVQSAGAGSTGTRAGSPEDRAARAAGARPRAERPRATVRRPPAHPPARPKLPGGPGPPCQRRRGRSHWHGARCHRAGTQAGNPSYGTLAPKRGLGLAGGTRRGDGAEVLAMVAAWRLGRGLSPHIAVLLQRPFCCDRRDLF
jgi:hypothetical protein